MDSTTEMSALSAAILLFIIMDPFGNIPAFLAVLKDVAPERRRKVITREMFIALGFLIVFLFAGRFILEAAGISEGALAIAGGILLFLIAIKMVFPSPGGVFIESGGGEPFVVPLAVPLVAGPSAFAAILLFMSHDPGRWLEWLLAVVGAWAVAGGILSLAEPVTRLLGRRGLTAMERLMGMLLVAISVDMMLGGITQAIASRSLGVGAE